MDATGSGTSPEERTLDEGAVDPDPFAQFATWYERAGAVLDAPEAMAVATADEAGRPSVRMVLLKAWGEDGFVFYTNYDGRKSRELERNPEAALLFYWEPLGRQVRVEGSVARTSDEESDAYFASRDVDSQLGAYASHQSQPISDRAALDAAKAERTAQFAGGVVSRPPWWGGWRLTPRVLEFWQQGPHRLHDRVRYERVGSRWKVERLQP